MIKLVVDSGCDLTQDMKDQKDMVLGVAPLTLQLGDQCFIDDETLDVGYYVDQMEKYPLVPKTAAPSPDLYLEQFKGEESIFAITLSSQLSASYNSALIAKQMYQDEIGGKFIHVVDSLSASVGEMLIALEILACSNKHFTDNKIMEHVTHFTQNMRTYFILERYNTAVKNGRMNPYVAKIATLMNLIPICWADKGKMCVLDKARGFNRAIARLADIMEKEGTNFENKVLGISHVQSLAKAIAFKDLMVKRFNFKEIIIVEASGLCSTYADKGGIIIAF